MKTRTLLLCFLTSFCGSTIAIFVSGLSRAGIAYPLSLLKWRLFFAAIFFYFLYKRRWFTFVETDARQSSVNENRQQIRAAAPLPWLVLIYHGLVPTFAAMLMFFYSICIGTPAGFATFLFFLYPVSNMLYGYLILSEKPSGRAYISLAIVLTGLALLLWDKADASLIGIVTAIVSGNLFGTGVICHRWYKLRNLSTAVVNFYVFMVGALAAVILDALVIRSGIDPYHFSGLIPLRPEVALHFLGLVLIGTVAFFTLLSYVSGKVENYLLGIFLSLEPALTTLMSVLILGESLPIPKLSGMALIMTGIIILSLKKEQS
ncbi:MAG: DMT family transporter [Candidatus Wallbacteria bacterium]|nr:DMT family transporter [Candidatus Wallbacteria bacterium]